MRATANHLLCTAAILALGIHAAQAAPVVFNAPADVKSITDIENALATDTNMQDLIGDYAPDAYVEDLGAPGLYKGRAQIQDAFTKQFIPVKSMKSNVLDMNIASDGKLACAALRINFDMAMKDGTSFKVSTRQLDAFKKIAGKWQIVQEQISVPLDPKTGLAAMNAQLPVRGATPWSADMLSAPATSPAKAKAEIHQWLITGAPIVDVDEMMTYFAPGNLPLLYDLTTPGEYRGASEIKASYAPLMTTLSGATDQLLQPYFIDSDGTMAIQIDTQNLQIRFKDGHSKIISFRQSDCFSHTAGKWTTFAEMLSFPVDLKTGKSITQDPSAVFK